MPDAAKISSEMLMRALEARSLLEQALDFDMPIGASTRIRQAMMQVERVTDGAAKLVNEINIARAQPTAAEVIPRARRRHRH